MAGGTQWVKVNLSGARWEQVAALAAAERRSVSNMVDRLLERALGEAGGRSARVDTVGQLPKEQSGSPASPSALGKAAVRVDPPAAAAPSASELAAKIPHVGLAGSLVKDATPFPKGKQAGRAKT